MNTLSILDCLPEAISSSVSAADKAGAAVLVFNDKDKIVLANDEQRRIMPCCPYGPSDTYSSLFWMALKNGFTGNPVAQQNPHVWLRRAIEVRENSPNLDWLNQYKWGRMLVSHVRLESGMSIQVRLDMRATGMEHYFSGADACLGVTRALKLRHEIRNLEGALDSLGLAVALVDRSGGILHANASFAELTRSGGGLTDDIGNRVSAADPCDDMILRQSLSNVASGIIPKAYITIRRPLRDPLVMAISTGSPGTAIIAVARFDESLLEIERALRDILGITSAEAEVIAAIGTGEAVADLSARRGVSIQTTYHQINRVKNKFKLARFSAPDLTGIASLVTGIAAITRAPTARKH